MNLLITGAWNGGQAHIDEIRALGHTVVWMQNERDALPCDYDTVEGVICNGLFLYHPIERFTSLRYIQLTSAGFDRVPMDYVGAHGIAIRNARGVYSVPMAELALCGVLRLYKQSRFFASSQAEHRWEKHRGLLELAGKTVCVIGCGSVGGECAKRFRAFDCRVLGVDVQEKECLYFDQVVLMERLDEALQAADIVVLTVPLVPETEHLMNGRRFAQMKPGAVLVNIARGAVVDTQSLIAALSSRLGGAVLDVFEEEPLPESSPLWDMENVVITPHNSFVGEGNQMRLLGVIMDNLEQFK